MGVGVCAHAAAIHGKYVYIEALGPGRMLSLCRVEVWGTDYDAWAEAGSNEDKWLYGAEPDWHHNGVEPHFFKKLVNCACVCMTCVSMQVCVCVCEMRMYVRVYVIVDLL